MALCLQENLGWASSLEEVFSYCCSLLLLLLCPYGPVLFPIIVKKNCVYVSRCARRSSISCRISSPRLLNESSYRRRFQSMASCLASSSSALFYWSLRVFVYAISWKIRRILRLVEIVCSQVDVMSIFAKASLMLGWLFPMHWSSFLCPPQLGLDMTREFLLYWFLSLPWLIAIQRLNLNKFFLSLHLQYLTTPQSDF